MCSPVSDKKLILIIHLGKYSVKDENKINKRILKKTVPLVVHLSIKLANAYTFLTYFLESYKNHLIFFILKPYKDLSILKKRLPAIIMSTPFPNLIFDDASPLFSTWRSLSIQWLLTFHKLIGSYISNRTARVRISLALSWALCILFV